ncbi:hypothetical protein [Streptomyces sp. NPDC002685]|uniref:hypothetical protein n=1 Tax=Streptomyces sp. NPDC002685 TaxID=3154540 RepID=UPI00331D505F
MRSEPERLAAATSVTRQVGVDAVVDRPSLSRGEAEAAMPAGFAVAEVSVADVVGATDFHSFRACLLAARTAAPWMAGRERTRVAPPGVVLAEGAVLEP